jgi:hypothetical protein
VAFRNEDELLGEHATYEEAFNALPREVVNVLAKKFRKVKMTLDLIEEEKTRHAEIEDAEAAGAGADDIICEDIVS